MYKKIPSKRYAKTLKMLKRVCPAPAVVFDLGVSNPFSDIMKLTIIKFIIQKGKI